MEDPLFCLAENNNPSVGQKIVDNAEMEFKGYSEEEKDRQSEIKKLNERLLFLNKKLSSIKNVKNYRLCHLNAQKSSQREKIRQEKSTIRLRLEEIKMERD